MTSGSRTWLGSVISAPSDCNWKMTSFSDFPIRFAMSLTRIFAAAIQSPWSCETASARAALTSFGRRRLFLGRRLFFSFFSFFRFFFVRVLFLALDVDLRADQLRGQTDVQAALADGERELVVVDDHVEVRPMGRLVAGHADAGDLRRRQRVLRVVHDVVVPGNDVDLLAAQLA